MDIEVWVDGVAAVGRLGSPLGPDELTQLVDDWTPFLTDQPDADWDWAAVLRDHPHDGSHCQVGLWADGRLQGAMILERAVPFRSDNLLEDVPRIVYLASAPWSRKNAKDKRHARVTPVGYLLLLAAIAISHQANGSGRLSWHSEPDIEWWYERNIPGLARYEADWDGERFLTLYELGVRAAADFREACRELGVAQVPGIDFDHA